MKIIVIGLPHTKTLDPRREDAFTTCAYTTKVWNLCRMMHERGHEVIHLGTEGSEPICTEHVDVWPHKMWQELYGARKRTEFYEIAENGIYARYMEVFEHRARASIVERCQKDWDAIVCIPWGGVQFRAVDGLSQYIVESGIGYPNVFANYRVYESYAWMHFHLGKANAAGGDTWYHVVIPNAFDPDLFGPVVPTGEKGDYFLCLCRIIGAKGVQLACQVARHLDVPIKIVGQGDPGIFDPPIVGPGVEISGPVGAAERRELLRHAKALFSPTRYVEPFGGVAVEAMMSGCPVISTDWGAYTETVQHGYTGFRCHTMAEFVEAARTIDKIDPGVCREWAVANYGLERVGSMYENYFRSLLELNVVGREGWTAPELDWTDLGCLKQDLSMFQKEGG